MPNTFLVLEQIIVLQKGNTSFKYVQLNFKISSSRSAKQMVIWFRSIIPHPLIQLDCLTFESLLCQKGKPISLPTFLRHKACANLLRISNNCGGGARERTEALSFDQTYFSTIAYRIYKKLFDTLIKALERSIHLKISFKITYAEHYQKHTKT